MAITHTNAASTYVRNALADAIGTKVGTGSGTATVKIYASATLLCTINLASTPFGSAASGTITANSLPIEGTVSQSGTNTADTFKVFDKDGNQIFSGTVTATGGGGDMTLSSTSLSQNDVVRLNTFTYSAPS